MSNATDAVVGMMDGAYFTSRNELLTFFNTLLELNLTKIEQTASGAVACQLMEYLFPNSIPMSRVNWGAKSSHEYVANYKLLQSAFNKHNIQRHVDVDKLIRGKYQDNLEFCQWIKAFFDQTSSMKNGGREGYDPVAVRAKGKGGNNLSINKVGVKKVGATASAAASSRVVGNNARIGAARSAPTTTTANSRPTSSGSAASSMTRASISTSNTRVSSTSSNAGGGQKENTFNSAPSSSFTLRQGVPSNPQKQQPLVSAAVVSKYEEEIKALQSENQTLQAKYSELEHSSATIEMTLQTVESERDFYFEKLRGIEVMLQVYKEKEEEKVGSGNIGSVLDGIFKVMYATMDDDVMVDDEGNLLGDIDITGGELSIDKSVSQIVKAQDELDEKEEVLGVNEHENLLEGDFHDTSCNFPIPKHSSNSFEMDEDELLTSDLDVEQPESGSDRGTTLNEKERLAAVVHNHDDDEFSDEDLLAD